MQMCEEEARARTPAGPDNDHPAATAEVASPRGFEGDSSSSQAGLRPDSPSLKVGNFEDEPCQLAAEQSGFQLAWLSSHLGHSLVLHHNLWHQHYQR